MILFIGLWHLVSVLGLIGGIFGLGALLGVAGLLQLLWGIADEIEQEKSGAEQQKRDRRSAGAKQGHATRRAKRLRADGATDEGETERVLRLLDEQAEAKR